MADVGAKLFPRGKTYFNATSTVATANRSGHSEDLLGLVRPFEDLTPGALPVPAVRRSMGHVLCMLVRNTSTVALLPGRLVSWKSGYRGKEVDGYTRTTGCEAAGVVDEFLPASGVQIGDVFWLVIKGHVLCKTGYNSVAANISAGDMLIAVTAANSTGTSQTEDGRITSRTDSLFTATETTDGTLGNVMRNRIGVAASGKTTSQTDADILVELDTHWNG